MLKIVLWIVVALVAVSGITRALDGAGRRTVASLKIRPVDFSALTDGVYAGRYDGGLRWSNSVEVVVQSGRVITIKVLKAILGQAGTERKIVERVVDSQSLEIDAVSGASLTLKASLKAVENALETAR